jgi:hypothetical protein
MERIAQPLAGPVKQRPLGYWSRQYTSTTSLATSTSIIIEDQSSMTAITGKNCATGIISASPFIIAGIPVLTFSFT